MGKKFILVVGVFLLGFVFLDFSSFFIGKIKSHNRTLGIKKEIEFKKVAGFENIYNFDYVIVNPSRVFLYLNDDKISGSKIKEEFDCIYLVNGGFYDSEFRPIGLFVSEGKEMSPWQKNRLFNAVFSINFFDTARITRDVPRDPLRVALQAGPLVFENGEKVVIKSSASFERRVIVGVTGDNQPVFLVFWSQDNFLRGPLLEELPYLIEEINKNFDLNIADAINLDGGSASAFYGDSLALGETSLLRSFFCLR